MTESEKSADSEWSDSLARVMVQLSDLEEHFQDRLGERTVQYSSKKASNAEIVMIHHYRDALLSLYHDACFRADVDQEDHLFSVRTALNEALKICSSHPAFGESISSPSSKEKFLVVLASQDT